MTPEQREHAKLHASYRAGLGSRLLDELICLSTNSDYGPPGPGKKLTEVLQSLSCEVDAVFTGFVAKADSFPTENGQLLFTDYQISVGDVFGSRNGSTLSPGSTAIVTQVGGEISVEGATIFAKLADYPQLKTGHEYIFFGKFLTATKAYHLELPGQVWAIERGRVKALSPSKVVDADVHRDGTDLHIVAGHLRIVRCK